ncbi:MAG: hypothetical protein Kapaf2KO_05400 [Candidatus Kapaibacteriales bacterium]
MIKFMTKYTTDNTKLGPYTPAIKSKNGLIFISGQIGFEKPGDKTLPDSFKAQCVNSLNNLNTVLAAASAKKTDVLKTTVLLADMKYYQEMNEIYMEFFGDHRPARAAYSALGLPAGALIEIEAIAESSDSE